MKKLLGISLFLASLYVALFFAVPPDEWGTNNFNLGERIGLYGIISLGAALVILVGGIDLSIGAVAALSGTVAAMLLTDPQLQVHPALAILLVLLLGAGIGLAHGLLITKVRLPAFVVTLCGLFLYRGLARVVSGNVAKGLGDQFVELKAFLFTDPVFGLPRALVILAILTLVATVFLHYSVYGRYLYAIGGNERAARYSGIATDRYRILAYVLCSTLAAFFGILFLMKNNAVTPSSDGNFFELYAIAAAVLGGFSLRGGEGTVVGILIGTAILWILPNLSNMWELPSEVGVMVMGLALLAGAILDELLRPQGTLRSERA